MALEMGERRRRNVPWGAWRAGRVVRVEVERVEAGVKERRMRVSAEGRLWELGGRGGGVNEFSVGKGWRVRWARGRGGEWREVRGE